MNALKANLSREALKGFFMFLFSESLRHAQDIADIKDRMDEVMKRADLSATEMQELEEEALNYVTF
jgi:hypothetical protein